MQIPRTGSAKRAGRRTALTLLAVALVLAAAAYAIAKAAKPDFSVSLAPSSRTLAPGASTAYTVNVKRLHGFKGSITLAVKGLPSGASAQWQGRSKKGNVIAAAAKSAKLLITTGSGTPGGSFHPVVSAKGGGASHTARLTVNVNAPAGSTPAANVGGAAVTPPSQGETTPPPPTVSVASADSAVSDLQGDTVTTTITVARGNGFSGPVDLDVTGLPSGVHASWSAGPTGVTGNSVLLTLAADGNAAVDTYHAAVTATGPGGTPAGSTPLDVTVRQTVAFTVTGNLSSPLHPGASSPVDVHLTNPYEFAIRVTALSVTPASTSSSSCPVSGNFTSTPSSISAASPVTLPAHASNVALSTLTSAAGAQPQVSMTDAPGDQSACRNVTLNLNYSGTATK